MYAWILAFLLGCGSADRDEPTQRDDGDRVAPVLPGWRPSLKDQPKPSRCYVDGDYDGHGDWFKPCVGEQYYEGAHVYNADDCDDWNRDVHPGAVEVCNGTDDDCDGQIDLGAADPIRWYPDEDGDGFGAPGAPIDACQRPWRHVADGRDCDDADASVNPGAIEWCNAGKDDDCDGRIDHRDPDYAGDATWFADADGDGFGGARSVRSCDPGAGWALASGDCDDGAADVWPGALEVCADGRDTDCDGVSTCTETDADATIGGTTRAQLLGGSIAGLGDVDADGHADFVVGSLADGWCWPNPGGAFLVRGGRPGAWGVVEEAAASISGARNADCVGLDVRAAGDLDGDGVPDYALTGGETDHPRWTTTVTAAWVVSGSARGALTTDDAFARAVVKDTARIRALGGAADIDGHATLVVAAQWWDPTVWSDVGGLYVFPGPLRGSLGADDARTWFPGEGSNASIRSGDLDGDGDGELLVDSRRSGRLVTYVLDEVPAGEQVLADVAIATLTEPGFHVSVRADAGDFDGDGRDDVVTFAADDSSARNSGTYVFAGPLRGVTGLDAATAAFVEPYGERGFGQHAAVGDIDGDGLADAALSAYTGVFNNCGIWVAFGGQTGTRELSAKDAPVQLEKSVQAVAVPGDVDGDGLADVLVGQPWLNDPDAEYGGRVLMFSGAGF